MSKPSEVEDILHLAGSLSNLIAQQLILKLEGKVRYCNSLSAFINECLFQRDIQESYHMVEHFLVQPQHLFTEGYMLKFKFSSIDDNLISQITSMLAPLQQDANDDYEVGREQFRDLTIALGQEPVKLNKRRESEAATQMFNF